jgi:hypothetical protein
MTTTKNPFDSSWIERLSKKLEKERNIQNQFLLDAAPDLLLALKVAYTSIERSTLQMGLDPAMDTECQYILAVIKKATTGKSK